MRGDHPILELDLVQAGRVALLLQLIVVQTVGVEIVVHLPDRVVHLSGKSVVASQYSAVTHDDSAEQ